MRRGIKTLHNFIPPATEEEIRASALQFVRKLSGSVIECFSAFAVGRF